ncbi:TolC family protein [Paraburkholderia aspalathi]|nr:TolC family protein [Paraburkholderia aspalathi]
MLAALALANLAAPVAQSEESSRGIPDLVADPLLTRPPVLDAGAVLPGDEAPIACPARVDFTQALSLTDAVDTALCADPQAMAAWANIKLQAATVGEARAAYLPTLSVSLGRQNSDTRYPSFSSSNSNVTGNSSYVALNWRLFDFGERAANRASARDLLAAAMASYDAALQKTLGATVQAYFDAVTARAAYRARTRTAQLAGETLAAAQRRELNGVTGRSDTLQAQTALARAQLAELRAAGDRDKTRATLVYTLGLPAGTSIVLPQNSALPLKQDIADLAEWLDVAEARHPAIKAAKAQWEAAREKITSVRSQGLPTVDFGVNFYQNGYPNQSLSAVHSNTTVVGVTLSIPLFEGFSRTYKVREAQARADQSEAQLHDAQRETLGDVVKAHADAVSSLASLDASATLLESAKAALVSSRNRYEHGAADILETLNAQSALADAEQERIRSEADWRAARLRLMAAAGVLGQQAILNIDVPASAANSAVMRRPDQ